uniref:Uncharacterized protein n=1 Tax=Vitis vinifera TaxID=29760 RepID=F6H9Q2_VITVI
MTRSGRIAQAAPPFTRPFGVQSESFSPLELFGVSIIKIAEEDQTIPAPKLPVFVVPTTDMYESTIGLVEGVSDFMDPSLSFDILSGFVTHSDYVYDDSVMDLSIYEYLSVSYDDVSFFIMNLIP